MQSAFHLVPAWFWGSAVFLFGAVWGSFLNVCIWRMPRDESVITPGSHCGSCQAPIPWYDNIPLISYFVRGGKCRKCGASFSFRYWLVEFLNAALWLLVWSHFHADRGWPVVLSYCLLISMLLIGTFIDFEFYIIPDRITLGLVVTGFLLSILFPSLQGATSRVEAAARSFLGILAGALSLLLIVEMGKLFFGRLKIQFDQATEIEITTDKLVFPEHEVHWDEIFFRRSDRIRFQAKSLTWKGQTFENVPVKISETHIEVNDQKYLLSDTGKIVATTDALEIPREAMGLGDVKLMAGIGAFVGWKAIVFILMASALVGSVVGITLVILRMRELQGKIPYGPYIALAAVAWLFVGQDIVNWYWNLTTPRY